MEIAKQMKIEKALTVSKYKESFVNSKTDAMFQDFMEQNIISQTKNFSFASIIAQNKNIGIEDIK